MPHIEPPSTHAELLDWALSRSKSQAEGLEQSREKARLREITRWAREAAEKAKDLKICQL